MRNFERPCFFFFPRRVRSSYKADERAKSVHGVHVAAASGRRHRHRHLVHAWVNSLAGLEQYRRDREIGREKASKPRDQNEKFL